MAESNNYKYDVFNESDIHCIDCVSIRHLGAIESDLNSYCEKTGMGVLHHGYCDRIVLKTENQ